MTRIRLYDSPFAPAAPQVFEVPSLAHWLLEHYGSAPKVTVQIFAGEPSAETEISRNAEAILAGSCPEYVVLQSPGEAMTIFYVVMAITAVAAVVLMPKPVMPGNVNRTQQSPNNSLGDRENKVRMLERVEDIYGTVKSIPSLMMPTYSKYIGHRKFEFGYYCVGRGYYDIAEVRDGDTLIADIEGASAAFYYPFTSPNSGEPVLQIGDPIVDGIVTARRAIEVDGITLKALNQVQPPAVAVYTFTPSPGGDRIIQGEKKPNFNSIFQPGDVITVTMAGFNVTSFFGLDFDGTKVGETYVSGPHNYSGTYTIKLVSDGEIVLTTSTWTAGKEGVGASITIADATNVTDWVTLPAPDRTEVWCNVVAPNGMFKDDNGKQLTFVNFTIEIEQLQEDLTPSGVVETVTGSLFGAVQDERAETVEHTTSWVGPARVRMLRTTPFDFEFKGTVIDEIKWTDLYSVSPATKADFGNKTTVHTVTQATARATAVKSRQLNCLASRKLPIFDGTTFSGALDADGRHVSGTIAPTSKLVDIIAGVAVDPKIGRRDLAAEVDMRQIWGVQQALDAWHPECGQFNFTFDTDNTSFEETVTSIANAGFCIAYRQNGRIRLAFDRDQPHSSALFTHRNKKPHAETITRKFASDAEYDGVEFVYSDPESGQSETITLPLDGSHTKAKKFEIPGIRSFAQAWFRANREFRKLLGQRITIETTTTGEARSLLPNSRVDIVDNTRLKSSDGEVVRQEGLTLTLSRDVVVTPGRAHSIVLMRRDGSVQSIPCRPGAAANQVVLQSLPSEAIVTSYGPGGIRTIYSFASDSAHGAQAYLVQEVDISDGQYVTIRAVNYSADYYAADHAPIPSRAAIIN